MNRLQRQFCAVLAITLCHAQAGFAQSVLTQDSVASDPVEALIALADDTGADMKVEDEAIIASAKLPSVAAPRASLQAQSKAASRSAVRRSVSSASSEDSSAANSARRADRFSLYIDNGDAKADIIRKSLETQYGSPELSSRGDLVWTIVAPPADETFSKVSTLTLRQEGGQTRIDLDRTPHARRSGSQISMSRPPGSPIRSAPQNKSLNVPAQAKARSSISSFNTPLIDDNF